MSKKVTTNIRRVDYTPPPWWVDNVDLTIDLHPQRTLVTATLTLRRNVEVAWQDCRLNGEGLELMAVELNGQSYADYSVDDETLNLGRLPEQCVLKTVVACVPAANTTMMGLYVSNDHLVTQCEAEGFRKITFFPDRPDVMSLYRVCLRADKSHFPVLLSNGNLIEQGELDDERHYAVWDDPFPKPCYLFALVAGHLCCREQRVRTVSGREVLLQVWVEPGNLDKTEHAMDSLVRAIRWDEQQYGLELDLDRFMIVAVSDFNMGAMENKGLNIFNTKYVLADPLTATDVDYANIESVVGHEYFHNWTGNRVTCRDWFQLSLKEGLTVFRDQEFSADMLNTPSGRAVKRIDDVRTLRTLQFAEDAGPMAHPIRPEEYQEISNFYSVTVYEKGAEVVRMLQTLLGREGFRRGLREYFRRHDGQAVTCDDFVSVMEAANGVNLTQFRRWYAQTGTPRVDVSKDIDPVRQTMTLRVRQSASPPLVIPLAVGIVAPDGTDLALSQGETTQVLSLTEAEQSFHFSHIPPGAVPSVLRHFSAPVILHQDLSTEDLSFLFAHDSDPFNRWEAGQKWMLKELVAHNPVPSKLSEAFRHLLTSDLDPAFIEVALTLPSESYLSDQWEIVDPTHIAQVRQTFKRSLAQSCESEWLRVYRDVGKSTPGRRALRNLALSYLVDLGHRDLARQQYADALNMTERMGALAALTDVGDGAFELADFYARFSSEPLVIDKWFGLQACSRHTTARALLDLLKHAAFNLSNPNRARSVILQFCANNPMNFHALDGSGYELWSEYVCRLDAINPQVAARLARCLDRWRRYTPDRRAAMQAALRRVEAKPGLSKDTAEVVQKALISPAAC